MKRIFMMTELGKLKNIEVTMFLLISIVGPLLLMGMGFFSATQQLVALVFLILLSVYLIFLSRNEKGIKGYPKAYIASLYLLLFANATTFTLILANNQVLFSYGIVLVLFAYLFVAGIVLYFIINLVYMIGLKKMFPEEGEIERKQEDELSLKKLSKYIDLDKQKMYFSISLINAFIYIAFVFFVMLLFIKKFNGEHIGLIGNFTIWVKEQDSVTVFNGISLFSLLIAIYTITFSAQNKIIKEAKEKYRLRFRKYL